jgi:hypothetical protein
MYALPAPWYGVLRFPLQKLNVKILYRQYMYEYIYFTEGTESALCGIVHHCTAIHQKLDIKVRNQEAKYVELAQHDFCLGWPEEI